MKIAEYLGESKDAAINGARAAINNIDNIRGKVATYVTDLEVNTARAFIDGIGATQDLINKYNTYKNELTKESAKIFVNAVNKGYNAYQEYRENYITKAQDMVVGIDFRLETPSYDTMTGLEISMAPPVSVSWNKEMKKMSFERNELKRFSNLDNNDLVSIGQKKMIDIDSGKQVWKLSIPIPIPSGDVFLPDIIADVEIDTQKLKDYALAYFGLD